MLRHGGAILRACLEHVGAMAAPGITTGQLDAAAETFIRDHGAQPAFKGYQGFPATICASVNEQCVHGIPGHRVLLEGEILSIDCGVWLHGFYTDACITVPIGRVSAEAMALMDATQGALAAALAALKAGARVGDVSHAIQQYAEKRGYSPVRSLTGHGVGRQLHDVPDIPNAGTAGTGAVFPMHTVVAIEPIIAAGDSAVMQEADGWTIRTRDCSLCAHFEHTVVVEKGGCTVLA